MIHPCFFPTLFTAGISTVGAVILRRAVRKEYASLLPWLMPWGVLCTFPALAFAFLCLPPFSDAGDRLNAEIARTGFEILTGTAGVLPGLLWDEISERLETNRALSFGLPAPLLRALMVAALVVLVLIPYGFLFNRQNAPQEQAASVQTESAVPSSEESVP